MSHPALTPVQQTEAIALLAGGHTPSMVASLMGVSHSTITRLAKKEAHSQLLSQLRESIRLRTLKRLKKVGPQLVDKLSQHVEALPTKGKVSPQDAAATDSLARAALGLEKIAASASGELMKAQTAAAGVVVQIAPWATSTPQATVIQPLSPPISDPAG